MNGINSYPLLELAALGRWDAVFDVFDQAVALGRPILRTNAFCDVPGHPARLRDEQGAPREEGLCLLDRLLVEAAARDVRLLLTLTNNWPDYGGAQAVLRMVAPDEPLAKDAFWSDPRALAAQAGFIHAVVGRTSPMSGRAYGRDAAIFGWDLANEAQFTDPASRQGEVLVRWARHMAREVRAAGARQPVLWGGSGYAGQYGEDLAAIAQDAAVDVLTLHAYPRLPSRWAAAAPRELRVRAAILLGAQRLHYAARIARRYEMPLIVEELGYTPPRAPGERQALDVGEVDAERAAVLRPLLALAEELGLPTMPWMIAEPGRPDYDGHLIRRADRATWAAVCRR